VVLLSLSLGIAAAYAPTNTSDSNPNRDWEAYKSKYKKNYRDQNDEATRHALFITATARVAELNVLNGKAGSAFGITWTSDRYLQEKHKKGLRKPKDFVPSAPVRETSAPRRNPKSVNWRYTEAVTAIKNQGQCGSCWAFSAAEAVESQMIIGTGGKLAIDLSPQQIASCTPHFVSRGCNPMCQRLQPHVREAAAVYSGAATLCTSGELHAEHGRTRLPRVRGRLHRGRLRLLAVGRRPRQRLLHPLPAVAHGDVDHQGLPHPSPDPNLNPNLNPNPSPTPDRNQACPTALVQAIDGPDEQLSGGYAAV